MGREVRRTTPDWQHPTDKNGEFKPLLQEEMPAWTISEATHYQMYEDTTEGTPISPVMDSPEALARWLADTNASAFGGQGANFEAWLKVCQGDYALSAVIKNGSFISDVEGIKENKKV